MLRRNARLRRESLYRKSLEGKERSIYEKKRKIREALAGEGGRRVPWSKEYLLEEHLTTLPRLNHYCSRAQGCWHRGEQALKKTLNPSKP